MSAIDGHVSAVDAESAKVLELACAVYVYTKKVMQKKHSSKPPRMAMLHKLRKRIDAELKPATMAEAFLSPPTDVDAEALPRLKPDDKRGNTSTGVVCSARRPHASKRERATVPASTHTIHRQWLQRLKDMPTTLQQLPLSQACVEVLWKCIEERWTWPTLQRCASEMEEALSHLCFYTREKNYVDLSRSIVWKQGLVEVQRLHTTPSPESPMEVIVPLSVDDFERVREMLYNRKLSEAGLYLVLMWVLCASPDEVDSLVVEDLHLFNDTSMWDSAMWCPDMVDLMATVRLPRGTRRGPFQVPTSLLMKDMQKLELLLLKRHKTERLFKHPEVLRGQVQALLEQQCQLSKPSLLSVRMGAAARLVEAGHGKASLWLDVSEQRSEAATQSAVAAARRMSMCLHFNSDDGREKCCWRIGEEMHDPTTRMGFYIAHAKPDDADALVKQSTTTMTEPTVLSADRQHDVSKWFVLCERPPHITEAEWAAAPRKARASHRCWLRQLQKLPPRTLKFSLAKACLKMFGELLVCRLGRDRVKHAAEELEAALMLLPMYTMQTSSIDLHASAVWRSGIKRMQHLSVLSHNEVDVAFSVKDFLQLSEGLRLRGFREASVYLTLMWLMAARPEDVESLVVKDIHVGRLPGTTRRSESQAMLDLTVMVRNGRDGERSYVVPTIISYMDAYRLVDLMSRRAHSDFLFQEPPRVLREQLCIMMDERFGLTNVSLASVLKGAISRVGKNMFGVDGLQWMDEREHGGEMNAPAVLSAPRHQNLVLYLPLPEIEAEMDGDYDNWDEDFDDEEDVPPEDCVHVKWLEQPVNHAANMTRLLSHVPTTVSHTPCADNRDPLGADAVHHMANWILLSGGPPHMCNIEWVQQPPYTRTIYCRWLQRLKEMPREWQTVPLSQACLRLLKEACTDMFWSWSGLYHAMRELEVALLYLPNFTDQMEGIDLRLSPVWRKEKKVMLRECCLANQRQQQQQPGSQDLGMHELQRIKELLLDRGQRAAFVYLVLMWVMAARPSEVDSLTAEDIALSPRVLAGQSLESATLMSISVRLRVAAGGRCGPFAIPAILLMADGQRLLDYLQDFCPSEAIFQNPAEVQGQVMDAISCIMPAENLSLLLVRETSLRCVEDSVVSPRWIDVGVHGEAEQCNLEKDARRRSLELLGEDDGCDYSEDEQSVPDHEDEDDEEDDDDDDYVGYSHAYIYADGYRWQNIR